MTFMTGGHVSVKRRFVTYGPLLTLMLGHFTNDMIGGVLPLLLPEAKENFQLDNAKVGLITLAYTAGSSLSQPIFGYICDRYPRRWFASLALVWGAAFASAWGFAGSFPIFLILALLGGLASGAYHPFGASNAAAVTPEQYRNTALSIYTVGGTTGYSLGPLVAVALLSIWGPQGTIFLIIPGTVAALLIYRQMGAVAAARSALASSAPAVSPDHRVNWGVLSRVIGIVMLRSWVATAVLQFLPIWFADMGYESSFYGPLVTTVILAGAAGTLTGGLLADRLGAKRLLLGSLLLVNIPLFLLVGFPGPGGFIAGALFGFIADSCLAVPLAAAQRLLPGRVGVASGMILGLGFITGGIGVPLTGLLADQIGIPQALALLSVVALAGVTLAWTVPAWVFQPREPVIVAPATAPEVSEAGVAPAGMPRLNGKK